MKFLLSLLFFLPISLFAQSDSCRLRISLLTATPGEELYSTFGHSALRVTDSINQTDIVFNYGTFNFEEPGFYTKFVRGKLMYFLSRDYFKDFVYSYQMEGRGMTEQVLNLSCTEKNKIVELLYQNLLPQNLFYKYDFLFDNCTTRLRDLIEKAADGQVNFGKVLYKPTTFRNLIHESLDRNDKQWSKLGIDILLGSKTDAFMTPDQVMFIPDYLLLKLDNAKEGDHLLVEQKMPVYDISLTEVVNNNLTQPFFIFTCLFALVAFLSFYRRAGMQKLLASLDGLLFFITGLLGFLLIFMWFGTDHVMCENNYNLLWAWPFNAITAFYIHSRKKWVRIYFLLYAIFNLFVLGIWVFMPQQMNPALIPIIGLLIFRSFIYIREKPARHAVPEL